MSKESNSIINIIKNNSSLDKNDLDFFIKSFKPDHSPISIYSFFQIKDDSCWTVFLSLYQNYLNKLDFVNSEKRSSNSFLSILFTSEDQNIFQAWLNDTLICNNLLKQILIQFDKKPIAQNEQINIKNFYLNQVFNVSQNVQISNENLFLLKKIIVDHDIPLDNLPPFFDRILLDQTELIPENFQITNPNFKILNNLSPLGSHDFSERVYQIQEAKQKLDPKTHLYLIDKLRESELTFPEDSIKTGFEFTSFEESLLLKNKPIKKELKSLQTFRPKYANNLFNIIKILKNVFEDIDEQILLNEITNDKKDTQKLDKEYWHWSTLEFKTILTICKSLQKEYDVSRIFKLLSQIDMTEAMEIHLDLLKQLESDLPEALSLIPDLKPFPEKPKNLTEIHNALNYLPKNLKNNRIIPKSIFQDWEGSNIGDYSIYLPKTEADLVRTGNILSFCVGQKKYRDDAVSGTSVFLILMNNKKEPKYCIEISKTKLYTNNLINDFLFIDGVLQNDYDRRHRPNHRNHIEELAHLVVPHTHKRYTSDNKWKIIQAKGFQNINLPEFLNKLIQEKLKSINNEIPQTNTDKIVPFSAELLSNPDFYIQLFNLVSKIFNVLIVTAILAFVLYKITT